MNEVIVFLFSFICYYGAWPMMKKRLTLSLVIPAYNEQDHLAVCLEAIANQTVSPDEVIVVDNNSTDRSVALAKAFPFVRVIHATKKGVIFARNQGFDAATSDIIGRIDADTQLPPTWVEHVKNFYANPQNHHTAWSGTGYFQNVRLPLLVAWAYRLLAFHFNRLLIGHYTLWGSNMALLRSQWRTVRGAVCKRTDIHEDLDLAMHIVRSGFAIAYDPTMPVGAELRRVHKDRHELWAYLQWWPRTLRVHGKKTWLLCWFVGAYLLYQATFILLILEVIGQQIERVLLLPSFSKQTK